MAKQTVNNMKLGMFLIAGLLILVFSLYMIGKNQSLFGGNFNLKARFRNINGLVKGNNVRFSGIQAGTVKSIAIVNDTVIEVSMVIDDDIRQHIHKNSFASIGSEGLMGNKVINIIPNNIPAPVVEEGDVLLTSKENTVDDLLHTLDRTDLNVEIISEQLKETVIRINNSQAVWDLFSDTSISDDVKVSINNIRQASNNINAMSSDLHDIITSAGNDKNVVNLLIKDTIVAQNLKQAVNQVAMASAEANKVIGKLDKMVAQTNSDLQHGSGVANAFLKDTFMVNEINRSLDNIEKGTAAFHENMEALKHNFLFRGYFKKQARKNNK